MKKALALITLLFACSLAPLDDRIAALVNREPISIEEVRNNIHFMTLYARNKKGRELVDAHLDLLIEKKLFAQEARRQGLEMNPLVRQVVDWAERDQMIKALYRDEVRNKVQPSEAEIRAAFLRGREQVRLRHLFARSEVDALLLKEQLDKGVPFEELAARTFHDSTLAHNGGDLGFIGYDDIDEKLAESAFALPLHQISAPVQSRYGWHILRVDNRRQQLFNNEAEYAQQRDAISKDLIRKLEKKAAGAYVDKMMSALDVKMINASFNILAANVKGIVLGAERMVPNYQPMLGGSEMMMMNDGIGGHQKEVLVVWKGGALTLGEFSKRVESLPVSERPRIDTPAHLRTDIGKLAMRELLVQQAKRQNLDKDPQVQEGVRKWREDYLFGALWQRVRDTLKVSPAEEAAFFATHTGRYREFLERRSQGLLSPDSLALIPELQKQVHEEVLGEKNDVIYARMAAELRGKARIRRNEKQLEALAAEFPAGRERIDMMGLPNK
ncbi:MAG TPA: peptidylprolyl isomerase [bacterium]|nr:peptidylprolyl isomerase [bacterium]HPR86978.1 peptidylprolyl isomerase [bacterium]